MTSRFYELSKQVPQSGCIATPRLPPKPHHGGFCQAPIHIDAYHPIVILDAIGYRERLQQDRRRRQVLPTPRRTYRELRPGPDGAAIVAWRPHAPVCCSSFHFPPSDGYRSGLWHSRIILPEQHSLRAISAALFRIAAFNFRREPVVCTSQYLPQQRWPSRRGGKRLALRVPATNSALGGPSAISPFALATALLIAIVTAACRALHSGPFDSGVGGLRQSSHRRRAPERIVWLSDRNIR